MFFYTFLINIEWGKFFEKLTKWPNPIVKQRWASTVSGTDSFISLTDKVNSAIRDCKNKV